MRDCLRNYFSDVKEGMGSNPSWYVTLPDNIGMDYINLGQYRFNLLET